MSETIEDNFGAPGVTFVDVARHREPMPAYKRLILAGTAIAAAVAPGFSGHPDTAPDESMSYNVPAPEGVGLMGTQVLDIPQSIEDDFAAAVAVDTCATRVTAEGTSEMYGRLWLGDELIPTKLSAFESHAGGLIQRYETFEARMGIGIGELPENFTKLQADARTDKNIPVEVYYQTAKEYFQKYGLEAMFDWEATAADVYDDPALAHMDGRMNPIRGEANSTEMTDVRVNIVTAMRRFAGLPPSMSLYPQVEQVYFGDVVDPGLAGFYEGEYRSIGIDLTQDRSFSNILMPHEFRHNHIVGKCGSGYSNWVDPALNVLNESFVYDSDNKEQLEAGELVGGQYTSLSNFSTEEGKIVSTDPYGTTHHGEDDATMIGNQILAKIDIEKLYYDSVSDRTILQEKIALMIERWQEAYPEEGEYMAGMLELANVYVDAMSRQVAAEKRYYLYTQLGYEDLAAEMDAEYWRLENVVRKINNTLDIGYTQTQLLDLSFDPERYSLAHLRKGGGA